MVHWHLWGALFINEHGRMGGFDEARGMLRETLVRASGLVLDQEFGLLALAPIYLLALPGLIQLWRRSRAVAVALSIVIAAAVASIVLPIINPYGFVGGWSPAPRFLVPIVPLLAIAVAFGGSGWKGPRRAVVWTLVAVQIGLALLVWNEPKVLWENGDGLNAVSQALPALRGLYLSLPTWHGPAASGGPFVVGALILAAVSAWLAGERRVVTRSGEL
jgi:hypothetical protein